MGYGKFMQKLAKGNEHTFVAYDSKEGDNGCFVYLRDREHAIFVPDEIIEHRSTEAIRMIRSRAEEGDACTTILELKDLDGTLVFEARHSSDRSDPEACVCS